MTVIHLPDEINRGSLGKYLKIIEECEECEGSGDVFVFDDPDDPDEGRILPCACKERAIYLFRLDGSNVRKKYRGFDLTDLRPEFVSKNEKMLRKVDAYLRDLRVHVAQGNGIFFFGPSGVAKSAIASYIIKEACRQGIPSYVDRLANIVRLKLSFRDDNNLALAEHILSDNVQLLALEEVDKVRQLDDKTIAGRMYDEALQEIMGSIYDSEKALLVTSNIPLESRDVIDKTTREKVRQAGLDSIFEPHIIDRFRALEPVPFHGDSVRLSQRWYKEVLESEDT